jgi:hypothetical protein
LGKTDSGERIMKENCWEFKKCQRQTGGKFAGDNPCPASTESRLDGVHGGSNGGRSCWSVVGTMCGEEATGKFAIEMLDCGKCEFYNKVREEEPDFKFSLSLLNLRRKTFSAYH